MSSYIKYMFEYLFEPDNLPADFGGAGNFSINSTGGGAAGGPAVSTVAELNSMIINDDSNGGHLGASVGPRWTPSKCLALARLFFSALANSSSTLSSSSSSSSSHLASNTQGTNNSRPGFKLGSFVEFEHLIRRQLSLLANLTISSANLSHQEHWPAVSLNSSSAGSINSSHDGHHHHHHHHNNNNNNSTLASEAAKTISSSSSLHFMATSTPLSTSSNLASNGALHSSVQQLQQQQQQQQLGDVLNSVNSFELLECYNQLQVRDYYNGYDIFIGLRIATSLTILFIVFILFVIYKTGCRDENSSRSQLRLTSSAGKATQKWAHDGNDGGKIKSKKATVAAGGGGGGGGGGGLGRPSLGGSGAGDTEADEHKSLASHQARQGASGPEMA